MSNAGAVRRLLLPLVPLYRLGVALQGWSLRNEKVQRLGRPVISIGNLSTGGAGKTPLTIALARGFAARGIRVDVLSRGYGRRAAHPLVVNPAGAAEECGDEPLVIAREAGVPVYVAAQRYEAGLLAEAGGDAELHLLDDGFQHRRLHRDVNLLLLNRQDWSDTLLPAGNLREPLTAIRRADAILIPAEEAELEALLRAHGFSGPVWQVRRRMQPPAVQGPVVAFCGIARPGQFFAGLEAGGVEVASRVAFRDHHRYIPHDIDCLRDAARAVNAATFVTTEKDRVRLGGLEPALVASAPLFTAGLDLEIVDQSGVLNWLVARIT